MNTPSLASPYQLPPLAGVILAGGQSSRMGQDKAALPVAGVPMLRHAVDVLRGRCDPVAVIGRPRPGWWTDTAVRFLPDATGYPAQAGPIVGVITALEALGRPALVIGCDMPALSGELLDGLLAAWALVPRPEGPRGLMAFWTDAAGQELDEPLLAVYHPDLLPALRDWVARGRRSLWKFAREQGFARWRVAPGHVAEVRSINDPAGYQQLTGREITGRPITEPGV